MASLSASIQLLKTCAFSSPLRVLAFSRPSLNPFLSRSYGTAGVALISQPRRFPSKPHGSSLSARCFSALNPELKSTLDKVVKSHKVILFMKGTKDFPQCGFSNTVVQILKSLNVPFETLNILENEMLRQGLKEYSNWPTFPQLYIDGEFFGGCDITVEAYKNGQLQELLEKAICS
ncbi:putative thioredoxin-disulfide reductase [Dioscorea sansibarensis]